MRLENEPASTSSNGAAPASGVRLSAGELDVVLQGAIARQGEALAPAAPGSTLEEALDIARQLDIPEEHVLASIQDLNKTRLRPQKREFIRKQRKAKAIGSVILAVVLAGLGTVLGFLGSFTIPTLLLYGGAGIAVLQAIWSLARPISDAEVDGVDLPPISGVCRVCGARAYGPKATFCEQHRYKGPS